MLESKQEVKFFSVKKLSKIYQVCPVLLDRAQLFKANNVVS